MMKNRWFRKLFRRRIMIALLIVLQVALLVYLISSGSQLSRRFSIFMNVLSALVVLAVVSRKNKGSYKTMWVLLILVFPLFGGMLYLMFYFQKPTKVLRATLEQAARKAAPLYELPGTGFQSAQAETGALLPQVRYLKNNAGFPVYDRTQAKYLSPGEDFWEVLLEELKKAEHYIFLEFFIVQEGKMWDSILEILKEKAAQGVTVRLLYDDLGCFFLLPTNYQKTLEAMGIQCRLFHPFRPVLTVKQNNRDHRKIVSIDGKVAFTGGINLADEYINAYEKHGHWKDSGIMVEGKAAWSFTLMFLQMWEVCSKADEDYAAFYPWDKTPCAISSDGLIAPYADSPLDEENVGEHIYLQILNQAENYVYINTPYLIVDDSVLSALCLAAKRGVDVRIVTPHRWDKRLVHITTRSYYRDLVKAGVRVYEYSNGFMHAKSFVCDDIVATVGTTNLDFRSLYLHFECGTWIWNNSAIPAIKKDFLDTLAVCQQMSEQNCKTGFFGTLLQDILRLFAPLM